MKVRVEITVTLEMETRAVPFAVKEYDPSMVAKEVAESAMFTMRNSVARRHQAQPEYQPNVEVSGVSYRILNAR